MPETYAFERSKDMRKKKVTSSDIAHAAGVSQATVSMILLYIYCWGDVDFGFMMGFGVSEMLCGV